MTWWTFWKWKREPPAEVKRVERLGLHVRRSEQDCSFCGGKTYAIRTTFQKRAPSGEVFSYLTRAFAYLCPRCKAVGESSDISCETMHVDHADERLTRDAAKARAERERL